MEQNNLDFKKQVIYAYYTRPNRNKGDANIMQMLIEEEAEGKDDMLLFLIDLFKTRFDTN